MGPWQIEYFHPARKHHTSVYDQKRGEQIIVNMRVKYVEVKHVTHGSQFSLLVPVFRKFHVQNSCGRDHHYGPKNDGNGNRCIVILGHVLTVHQ
jgi:hypothetical protein